MNELSDVPEELKGRMTVEEIAAVRAQVSMNNELNTAWQEALYQWNNDFKARITEKYGSAKCLQEVPSWQSLVGGSVEPSPTLSFEQKQYIESEVTKFVQQFKAEYGL